MLRVDAMRDLVLLFCGQEPPFLINRVSELSEEQVEELQWFLAINVKMKWLTGIGVLEVLDSLVDESVSNSSKAFEVAIPYYAAPMDFRVGDAVKVRDGKKHLIGLVVTKRGKKASILRPLGYKHDIDSSDVVDVLPRKWKER